MKRAALWMWIALAAFSCTDEGKVGRLRPKPPAAQSGAAGQLAPVCSKPPCAVLPCNPVDWWCPLCASDADCADEERDKLCNPLIAFCVECRDNDDCPAHKPFCDTGDCGECAEDEDCPAVQRRGVSGGLTSRA